MKKVVYIPIDTRPYHTSWMEKFALRGNVELIMYPKSKLGTLHQSLDPVEALSFIKSNALDADYLIIALDALCSGGLVQSRLGLFDPQIKIDYFKHLFEIKERNPKLKIYAYDTVMRTTVTSYGYQSKALWQQINAYSRLKGQLDQGPNEEIESELNALVKTIDPVDLNRFLTARSKKHTMNLFYIEAVQNGSLDYLTLLQEDCMKDGLQAKEQNILKEKIKACNVDHQVKLYNGTDEGAAVLLAKIIVEIHQINPKIYIHLREKNSLNEVMPYEDRPCEENLSQFFAVIGLKPSDYMHSDAVLAIYSELVKKPRIEAHETFNKKPTKDNLYQIFIQKLNQFITQKPVLLVDLLFPNGGSIDLISDINYRNLTAYSAWNTASNSMGTALCDLVCYLVNPKYSNTFLAERIMDDVVYQAIIRDDIDPILEAKGINIYDLKEHYEEVLAEIKHRFMNYSDMFPYHFSIYLPWKRTFEIDIEVMYEKKL